MSTPSGDLLNRSQWTTALDATTRKTTSAVSAELGPMAKTCIYILRSTTDAFFIQGATGVVVTTTTGHPILAGETARIYCDDATANGYVAIITASGAGVATLSRVN